MQATLRLILWPSILTLVVSVLRLVLEVQGVIGSQSGGGFAPLGITWLVFVFGGWFGWRLAKSGSRPALSWPVLWALLPLVAIVAAVGIGFGQIDRAAQSDDAYTALRATVGVIAMITLGAAAFCFVVWPRLALTVLLYALPARATVLALTYLAKVQEWDTHYTKFGPGGIESELGETMFAASVAQMGFWVPFTVVGGAVAGTIASRLTTPKTAHPGPGRR